MAIKAILFDLDGTLLPMDQEVFVKAYFKGLAAHLAPLGYEPHELMKAIWGGTDAMIANDGKRRNDEVFWDAFCSVYGEDARADEAYFAKFYETEFQNVKGVCGYREGSGKLIKKLKDEGLCVILATNPIFPSIATESRIRWAGMEPEDFEFYTTYENINYCKPNRKYYEAILEKCNLAAEECLMVGNDVGDDMVAEELGMKVFLLTEDLINHDGKDISAFPNGDFAALCKFIDKIKNEA